MISSGLKFMMVGSVLTYLFPYTTLVVLSIFLWLEAKEIDFNLSALKDVLLHKLVGENESKNILVSFIMKYFASSMLNEQPEISKPQQMHEPFGPVIPLYSVKQ